MIEKWHIYRASLDPVVGSGQGKSRPVLVISEDAINKLLNVVNILPITSRKPGRTIYPNEVLLETGTVNLPNESIILCHQIRTVDKRRLTVDYGILTDSVKQEAVYDAVCFQLGIDRL
ncbi:MAG: type II toxin-antitoxin system PemK/MazF family toxin [Bacteroidetes bacterium]|nr:type II toxin-antitoxin system PemK/MazF family toxin [Fibrella sp.]